MPSYNLVSWRGKSVKILSLFTSCLPLLAVLACSLVCAQSEPPQTEACCQIHWEFQLVLLKAKWGRQNGGDESVVFVGFFKSKKLWKVYKPQAGRRIRVLCTHFVRTLVRNAKARDFWKHKMQTFASEYRYGSHFLLRLGWSSMFCFWNMYIVKIWYVITILQVTDGKCYFIFRYFYSLREISDQNPELGAIRRSSASKK